MSEINTRKRGDKWEYRFEIAPANGKRRQKSKGGFKTKKEALEAGTKALNEYNNSGFVQDPVNMSVSDYFDLWFNEYCKLNLKYNSLLNYQVHIEKHIKPNLGEFRLSSLTPATIQKFINSLRQKGLSKSHVGGIKSTLTTALNYAVQPLGLININPALSVIMPKFEKKDENRYFIEKKDFDRILNRFPSSSNFYIALILGYTCGLRISETYALDWDHIDFENKTLRVDSSLYKRFQNTSNQSKVSGWYIGTPKTDTSTRTISLDDFTLEVLRKEKNTQLENKLFYGEHYTKIYKKEYLDENGNKVYKIIESVEDLDLEKINLINIKENGEMLTIDSFKYCARVIKHDMGIGFNYHSLRHTHATLLVENGANPKNVAARLGHSKIDLTLNLYTHNTEKMENETVSILNKIVNR